MSKLTKKDAVKAVELLCEVLGKPYGGYVKNQAGELVGNGGYALDYTPTYGGCVIHEFDTTCTGVNTPFGQTRMSVREFIQSVHMTIFGMSLMSGRNKKDRGIRLAFVIHGDEQEGPDLTAELFSDSAVVSLGYAVGEDFYETFSADFERMADQLNLHYDRTALDEWLKEDPR
jgi:hypothetical protein